MTQVAWLIVLSGAAILTIATGIRQTFGLYLGPMSADIQISREMFGFAMGMSNLLWGLCSPFAGGLADKFGTGKVIAAGGILYVLGMIVIATATGGTGVVLGSALIGAGISGAGFTTVIGAVGRAVPPDQRSLALGISVAGGSFGQFVVVPIGDALLHAFGWVATLWLLAGLAAVMVPLAAGVAKAPVLARAPGAQSTMAALREASRHSSFWLLTAGFFVCGFHVVFVATHLPTFLADRGLPAWVGAWALALVGLFNIVGTYGAGVLGTRYPKRLLLAWLYALRALVFLIFIIMPLTPTSVLIFAGGLGLLWLGTVPLTSGLVGVFFGPTYMAMLYGIVFLSHQVGSFLGAWLGGYFYDLFGNYDAMWWISVALGIFSALIHLPIREVPVARLAGTPAR